MPSDEAAAIVRHLRELDRLGEDLVVFDREIAEAPIDEPAVKRIAAGLIAAIGDVSRSTTRKSLSAMWVSIPGSAIRARVCST